MKKVILSLMVIILFYQCKKDSENSIDDSLGETIKMWDNYDSDINKKTVYLANNGLYLIKTCLDTFLHYISQQ